MTGPGRPLGPVNIPFIKVPNRDLWVNINTGQTVNRNGYRNIVAQKYGFRNASDYDRFSAQLNGIGGLGGLRVKDVQRAHNIVRKYERDHGLPKGSFGIENHFQHAGLVRAWLQTQPGKQRNSLLLEMLDRMGVPPMKYRWVPGDS
jgi:hypothetical protein